MVSNISSVHHKAAFGLQPPESDGRKQKVLMKPLRGGERLHTVSRTGIQWELLQKHTAATLEKQNQTGLSIAIVTWKLARFLCDNFPRFHVKCLANKGTTSHLHYSIKLYFKLGWTQSEILNLLSTIHEINVGMFGSTMLPY